MKNNTIGDNIAKLRKQNNMTQVDLANKLNFTYQTISSWERGVSSPDVDSLTELCHIFNVSLDVLCGIAEKKEQPRNTGLFKDKEKRKITVERVSKATDVFNVLLVISVVLWAITILSGLLSNHSGFFAFIDLLFNIVFLGVTGAMIITFLVAKKFSKSPLKKVLFTLASILQVVAVPIILIIISLSLENLEDIKNYYWIYMIGSIVLHVFLDLAIEDQPINYCPKIHVYKGSYYASLFINIVILHGFGSWFAIIDIIALFFLNIHKKDKTYLNYTYTYSNTIEPEKPKPTLQYFSYKSFLSERSFKIPFIIFSLAYVPLFLWHGNNVKDVNIFLELFFVSIFPILLFTLGFFTDRKRNTLPVILNYMFLLLASILFPCFSVVSASFIRPLLITYSMALLFVSITNVVSFKEKFTPPITIALILVSVTITAVIIRILFIPRIIKNYFPSFIHLLITCFYMIILTIVPRKKHKDNLKNPR